MSELTHPYKDQVRRLIEHLVLRGYVIERVNNGGYSTRFPGVKPTHLVGCYDDSNEAEDLNEFLEEVIAVDESHLYIWRGKRRIWLWIVLGNDPGELVADFQFDEDIEKDLELYAVAEERIAKLSAKIESQKND